jgi:hypothetical protein
MISKLDRPVLTSAKAETQTSHHPGFVMCPVAFLSPFGPAMGQKQMYRLAYLQALAQLAAQNAAALRAGFDPSWN